MDETLQRFQRLLRDIFQVDYADLDTGIYRLFKVKRAEVDAFIEGDLPAAVEGAFGTAGDDERAGLRERADRLAAELRNEYDDAILATGEVNPERLEAAGKSVREKMTEYTAAQTQLAGADSAGAERSEVFRHLAEFFGRYYEDGDFIPRRRYGRDESYAVPYAGEEVLTHWATRGMHYVKSGERLRTFAFEVPGGARPVRVEFAMTDADLPRDNAKGDRRLFFPLADAVAYDDDAATLTVPFHYRPATTDEASSKQGDVLDAASANVLARVRALAPFVEPALAAPQDEAGTTLLLRRLRHFTRRQTTDYFVYPDLAAFLRRELDFYLKDEVLSLGDLDGNFEAKRTTIRVVREVAHRVIAFLDQVEQVQVRLFEKPKWALQTDYLIPVRHVPEALWPEVLGNAGQAAAWTRLFGTPAAVDAEFLRAHPTLVVDTGHFDRPFVYRLLAALPFDDLDEATDGVLVAGENYQALTALRKTFDGRVPLVYIDPPYNTGTDGFVYKDVGSSRVDLQACKLEYSIVSPK